MSQSDRSSKPVEIFYSYSHKDEKLRNKLETHLSLLKQQGLVINWHDRKISAGKEWQKEINIYLNTAHIVLLLISPDFLASDFCYSIEMKRAVERHERGEAHVIPIILRPVYWHGALFGKLQALPTDAKPITGPSWHNQDEAFFNVAEGIRKVVEEFQTESSNNDEVFADFLSNKEFIHDVEVLFSDIQANMKKNEQPHYENISLIAINIDHLNNLASTYGDSYMIDLSKAVGLRIKDKLSGLVNPEYTSLYHIDTGMFYIILKNMSLEEVRVKANQLKQTLNGEYHFGPNNLYDIPNVTVHLGISCYTYSKLSEIVGWLPVDASKEEARKRIVRDLEEANMLGISAGGNVVISWDTQTWGYIRLPPLQ